MSEPTLHTVDLQIGYRDSKGAVHTRVVFGRRITGKTLFGIESDPQSSDPTQFGDLLARAAIVEFGTLKMPVPLGVFLRLDSADRAALSDGFNEFLSQVSATEKPEDETEDEGKLADEQVKLICGYDLNGVLYNLVTFGAHITGMDEVQANRLKLSGSKRACFLAGKQILKLSQSDGASEIDGPISVEVFEKLDAVDIDAIRAGAVAWQASFRRIAACAEEVRTGEKRPAARS